MSKPIVVWASDLHVNEMSSICPPKFWHDSGHETTPPPELLRLWEAWIDAWGVIRKRNRETVVVFGGEFADLDTKKRTNHLITKNRKDIRGAVMKVIAPALKCADLVIVLKGTEAHSGLEGDFDADIAEDILGVNVYQDDVTKARAHWRVRTIIGGKRFDFEHHTRMGTSNNTEKNAANAAAIQIKNEYADWGEELPHWAIRGHVHRVSDSGINFLPLRVVTAPCWSLPNPYAYRQFYGGRKPQIGLIVIDTEKSEPEWIRYEIKRPPYTTCEF